MEKEHINSLKLHGTHIMYVSNTDNNDDYDTGLVMQQVHLIEIFSCCFTTLRRKAKHSNGPKTGK